MQRHLRFGNGESVRRRGYTYGDGKRIPPVSRTAKHDVGSGRPSQPNFSIGTSGNLRSQAGGNALWRAKFSGLSHGADESDYVRTVEIIVAPGDVHVARRIHDKWNYPACIFTLRQDLGWRGSAKRI